MYVTGNPPTKKALKEMVASGKPVTLFSPGFGIPNPNGIEYVEGPHHPKPHSWYAQVTMKNGKIVKVQ